VGPLAPRTRAFLQSVSQSAHFKALKLWAVGATSSNCIPAFFLPSLLILSMGLSSVDYFAAHPADRGEPFGDPSRLLAQEGARGRTYYMSPSGSDANSGVSTSSPWKTFAYAIPRLNAGDTLVLMDGTYATAGSGNLTINCTTRANARSANPGMPITVKSQNQRKALLHNDGASRPVLLSGCRWWVIDGLSIRGSDNPNSSIDSTLIAVDGRSSDNIIRNNLLFNTNRYRGGGGVVIYNGSTRNLVEGNELYNFSRNGLYDLSVEANSFRRNYCNARDYPRSPQGGPRTCFDAYYSNKTLFENNIAENVEGSLDSKGSYNMFLGNISINASNQQHSAKHPQERRSCDGNYIENHVGIAGSRTVNGAFMRSCTNYTVKNSSFFGGTGNGVVADNVYDPRQGNEKCRPYTTGLCRNQQDPVITVQNVLVKDTEGGYSVEHREQFARRIFEYSLGWNNPKGAWRSGTETRDRATTPPPGVSPTPDIGSCRVFIPASSSLKGKGKNGQDIGANILYAYENGVLTNKPLWNPQTGQFPCGAIIPGINDIPGQSCFDVHTRLNVNTNGCSLPKGYSGHWPPAPGPLPGAGKGGGG
jgi:hypothetical protein